MCMSCIFFFFNSLLFYFLVFACGVPVIDFLFPLWIIFTTNGWKIQFIRWFQLRFKIRFYEKLFIKLVAADSTFFAVNYLNKRWSSVNDIEFFGKSFINTFQVSILVFYIDFMARGNVRVWEGGREQGKERKEKETIKEIITGRTRRRRIEKKCWNMSEDMLVGCVIQVFPCCGGCHVIMQMTAMDINAFSHASTCYQAVSVSKKELGLSPSKCRNLLVKYL